MHALRVWGRLRGRYACIVCVGQAEGEACVWGRLRGRPKCIVYVWQAEGEACMHCVYWAG